MDNNLNKNKKISTTRVGVFRTFITLILIFTIIVYSILISLIYLKYSVEINIIYTDSFTNLLIGFILLLFILGWFFIYTLYRGIIKPVYETFSIVSEIVNKISTKDSLYKDQLIFLQEFINSSLLQLNKSPLTKGINLSLNTETYIKRLGELIKQNEDLISSKEDLSNLIKKLKEQKDLLELEKAKTSAIIDSLPNGLLVTSRDGNIFLVNQELEKLLDKDSNHLLGKFVSNVLPEILISYESENINENHHHKNLFNYKSSDNKKNIAIESISSPIILNNDIFGSVYILRDTTQELATERAQKEFVSLASHQLRTPVTSIKWNSELILSNEEINETIKMAANDIYEESNRMEKLINSLLHLSRIDLGKIQFITQKINLDQYIDSLIKTLKPEIDKKNLKLEKNIIFDEPILNDPAYIDIIIGNILYNAVRYTNKGGCIKLNIYKNTDKVCIEISDTGIGIPKDQQPHIFSRLFRADNAKNFQTDGNGLGLYVVKKLIELMKGSIWFESKENQGTTFFLEFPIAIN